MPTSDPGRTELIVDVRLTADSLSVDLRDGPNDGRNSLTHRILSRHPDAVRAIGFFDPENLTCPETGTRAHASPCALARVFEVAAWRSRRSVAEPGPPGSVASGAGGLLPSELCGRCCVGNEQPSSACSRRFASLVFSVVDTIRENAFAACREDA